MNMKESLIVLNEEFIKQIGCDKTISPLKRENIQARKSEITPSTYERNCLWVSCVL